jgi:AAA+ ATPase superfamily predicted ATPase
MFVGRKYYLDDLASLWRKATSSLVACRGRRRVGKSRLFREFAMRTADQYVELAGLPPRKGMTNQKQLDAFAAGLARATNGGKQHFGDWSEAFAALDKAINDSGRTVVMLDEISWMGGWDADFPGYLKTAWDTMLHLHDRLIVVVCGSVNAWIKENILDNTGFVGRFSRDYVLPELDLGECLPFWRKAADRVDTRTVFDILSITGGIPRYLEELDPGLSAEENIRRMCFVSSGTLFKDFNEIFAQVFGADAVLKRAVLSTLAAGPMTGAEIAAALGRENNGHFSEQMRELELAGFVTADRGMSPVTGKRTRVAKYRIRDNYTRFYLRYIEPHREEIANGSYRLSGLGSLPGWDSVMGLQFENLIVNHAMELVPALHLGGAIVQSAAPYRHERNSRGGGCQVDLLMQTSRTAYLIEIKRQNRIGVEVEEQVEAKMRRLHARKGLSVRPVLVYLGELDGVIEGDGFFDALISAESLL